MYFEQILNAEENDEDDSDEIILDAISVTGQKVERDLQETTDSVTVFTQDEIEEAGVEDLRDAFRLAPNVNFSPSNNGNNGITIRGINSEGVGSPGGNQTPLSSFVLDGAAQSLEGTRKGGRGVWDVESIEILRGPQIAIGRNALAGAVLVNTNDPAPFFETSFRLGFDTEGRERAVMFNTPLGEQFAFRFAYEELDKSKNIDYLDPSLEFLDNEDFYNSRAKLSFNPTALPEFNAQFTWSSAHDDPAITAVDLEPPAGFSKRTLSNSFESIETRINDVDNYIFDMNYAVNSNLQLTSVSTYTVTKTKFDAPAPTVTRDEEREDFDFSQDLRATYTSQNGRFRILAGGFIGRYKNERDSFVQTLVPETTITFTDTTIEGDECVNVDITANPDGRWFEYLSDGFAQIDQGFNGSPALDGFFLISELPNLVQIGAGADVFPSEGNWAGVGDATYDSSAITGVGNESASLQGGLFDFDQYVADDDSILNIGYDTSAVPSAGNINFNNGTPVSIDGSYDVAFTYDASAFGLGLIPFSGNLQFNADNTFDLFAGNPAAQIGDNEYVWDFDGTYALSDSPGCSAPGTVVSVPTATPTGNFITSTLQNLESETKRFNRAFYTEMEWAFTKKFRLLAGLRYDVEEVDYTEFDRQGLIGADDTIEYSAWLPRAGLVYDITDRMSVGLTASRGYRGGFIDRGVETFAQLTEVDPEFLWAYELSFRSMWLDDTLRANANIFYYDWTDQQISIRPDITVPITVVANAGSSELYGSEISFDYLPTGNFFASFNLGLLKTKFLDFDAGDLGDFSGNEFSEAPELTASLLSTYYFDNGIYISGDINYLSDYFATSDVANLQSNKVDSRAVTNVRLGYETYSGNFTIFGEIKNLFDKEYLTGRDINQGAYIGDERVYGVFATISFD
ncbi:MAG: TonB-dependent receptor [Pseudomonadota bacterium]